MPADLHRFARVLGRFLVRGALVLAWLWCIGGLAYLPPGPGWLWMPQAEALQAFRIDRVAQEGPIDASFSARIRSRRPAPR